MTDSTPLKHSIIGLVGTRQRDSSTAARRLAGQTSHASSNQSLLRLAISTRSLNVTESNVNITAFSATKRPAKLTPVKPREISIEPTQLPMPGVKAATIMFQELTELERTEILEYQEVYYVGKLTAKRVPCEAKENHGFDDDKGNYLMTYDDHLDYRYEIRKLLGRGSFGQVVQCFDHKRKGLVAVKVVTNASKFRKQSKVEVSILEFLNRSSMSEYIVRMKACFSFRSHICIVLELLGSNLYQVIKLNKHKGSSNALVKRFTGQIVDALVTLHSYKIAHCDLKPENVLMTDTTGSVVKLVDFGSSCYEGQTIYSYIQSRYYRAPEVILGLTYGCSVDMWSLGCLVAELVNGVPMFSGDSEYDQLLAIMEVIGLPPQSLVSASPRLQLYFTSPSKPILRPNKKGFMREPGRLSLATAVKSTDLRLLDFIRKCLDWQPATRLTPEDAQKHPFLTEDLTTA